MSVELESWCRGKVKELLLQKEKLLEEHEPEQDVDDEAEKLPHYNTMLEMYRAIEKQELLLLEINDRIKILERKKDLNKMKKALACVRCQSSMSKAGEDSFIRDWMYQILQYNREVKCKDSTNADSACDDCLFYDVEFKESAKSADGSREELVWSTRYKGRCVRVHVSAPSMCRNSDKSQFVFSASFYVDSLVEKGQEFIAGGQGVEQYVREVLWAGLQKLIDV